MNSNTICANGSPPIDTQTVAVREVHLPHAPADASARSTPPIRRSARVPYTSLQRPQMPVEPSGMSSSSHSRTVGAHPVHIRLEQRLYFLRPHAGERVRSRTLPSPVLLLRRQRSLIPVPDLSLMSDAAAAACCVLPFISFCLINTTCRSVSNIPPPGG